MTQEGVKIPTLEYVIGLGSNMGDRHQFIVSAIELLKQKGVEINRVSSVYETQPIGEKATACFLNGAALCSTIMQPDCFMKQLLSVESSLGRRREIRWGDRTIDLDILMCRSGGETIVYQTDIVRIPHPRLLERAFAMIPAAEVAADWICMKTQKTLADEVEERGYKLRNPKHLELSSIVHP